MKNTNILTAGLCSLLISIFSQPLFAQAGKDGAATVSTTGVIYNRYTALAQTGLTGDYSITVANMADLSAGAIPGADNNPYATAGLTYGDLVMVIKMQGATINTTNTPAYGAITAMNNTGVYELKIVRAAVGNVITFCSPLANDYVVGGTQRVQVVRMPRLSALRVSTGASLTAQPWSGSYTGGVIAMDVAGNLLVNGSITTSGLGFRGGATENISSLPGNTNYVAISSTEGGEKGESIAGYQDDYDAIGGRYNRGAPANGGGAGNAHNAGGGGGANGYNGATWNGQGKMMVNAENPINIWAFDLAYIANGNAPTLSSGGGKGGYSFSFSDQDATILPPGSIGWDGDSREQVGGFGGRPLTYSTNTLFLGGGGGGGDANNSATQSGANGGGIIYLSATGSLSGTGSITADGDSALPTRNLHTDAASGGGGGGAIVLNVQGTIAALTITANGGHGGNQLIQTVEAEGPGGGGGGGYISTTGTPIILATGGLNGTTTSIGLLEFTSNGATAGAGGEVHIARPFVSVPLISCFALPVTLFSFDARLTAQKEGLLTWVTDEESGMQKFVPESSADGRLWKAFATVMPTNTSGRHTYTANAGLVTTATYYRLKMMQLNGGASYSTIKKLSAEAASQVTLSHHTLTITGLSTGAKTVELYSGTGSLLYSKSLSGQGSLTVAMPALPAGIYYANIYYADGHQQRSKLIQP